MLEQSSRIGPMFMTKKDLKTLAILILFYFEKQHIVCYFLLLFLTSVSYFSLDIKLFLDNQTLYC